MVGIFTVQRLTAEIKLSAAKSVAIVAGLVFCEGLWALWSLSSGFGLYRFVVNASVLGLIAAPLLLAGSRIGYWYALVDMTFNAIWSAASLTILVWVEFYKLSTGGPVGDGLESGLMIVVIFGLPISWLAVRLLRSEDVRIKFNV
ncbi:MAG TPA: hypothetical protein VII69_04525 [Candidatus Eremiobacteraceae bacterium]